MRVSACALHQHLSVCFRLPLFLSSRAITIDSLRCSRSHHRHRWRRQHVSRRIAAVRHDAVEPRHQYRGLVHPPPKSRSTASASPTSAAQVARSMAISPCCPPRATLTVQPRPLAFAPMPPILITSNEVAHPGYYAVTLANGIRVEITVAIAPASLASSSRRAQPRVCLSTPAAAPIPHPTTPSQQRQRTLRATASTSVRRTRFAGSVAAGGFCGTDSHYKLYVAGRFDKPYKTLALWQDDTRSLARQTPRKASTPAPGSISAASGKSSSRSASRLSAKPAH